MDAVVFDMDGVLVDSVWRKHERRRGYVEDELDLGVDAVELVGLNAYDKHAYLAERTDVPVDAETFATRLDELAEDVYAEKAELLPVFEDLADELRGRGVRVGLASAASRHRIEAVVDRFDLGATFDAVVSADDVAASKPAPDIYAEATDRLGVAPERAVAVEDSENGATAAVRAGLYCLGYAPDHHPPQDLSVADEVVGEPDRLRERVLRAVETERQ